MVPPALHEGFCSPRGRTCCSQVGHVELLESWETQGNKLRCEQDLLLAKVPSRFHHLEEVAELDDIFREVYPLIRQYETENALADEHKVLEFRTPAELKEEVDVGLPEEGSVEKFVEGCRSSMKYSVRTSHPRFMNQLYAGSDPAGQVAELLSAVLNTTIHTYGAAPFFSVLERQVIEKLGRMLGFQEHVDGVFAPGGSYANMVALIVARNQHFPHVREHGWRSDDKPVIFTSSHAHYSVAKAAMITGMGSNQVVAVPTDEQGRMQPAALEEEIMRAKESGRKPFYVSCTAGTTVTGAFDPIDEICQICRRHEMWLHTDGAWGGAAIFSEEHRNLLRGVEGVDSFCLNPHKMLGVPMQCSVLILNNHEGRSRGATEEESLDLGQKSLQCGRKPDCLKLWLCWKRHGTRGFARRVDRAYTFSQKFAEMVRRDPRFYLLMDPISCNVCFFYLPPSLRQQLVDRNLNDLEKEEAQRQLKEFHARLGQVTQIIYRRMQKDGKMLINFSPLKDRDLPHFFRAVMIQQRVTEDDLVFILDHFEHLGKDL
ncbi:hypothetical protein GUITHDRAFT_166293 [Guillardia theta CCMP2712]|uniref:Glutamate decarboxylase n=1 Tax=Guillardia theta (strain CCMP2712) TaxID=905079 RepID=L1IDX9_GUITC|nr:hypothetical protein GUITHDRAFT_166293 [Guillardia theta CCMP2712]EKX34119.1 hypothetical protein GUITHDRAFT_166293 [Guillardia theta CCMP2712]|eukprot:XP_005821099.1 hypothetical protein GUITHDRAFT_166293 [Guillardia theta CCMP2712]